MGIVMADFCVESVVRNGLAAIRNTPTRLDNLFENFKQSYLAEQYGQKAIDKIKTFIQDNEIKIVQGHSLIPTSLPCISITMSSASEMKELACFSDYGGYEDTTVAITPIATFTPSSYSSLTGKVSVADGVDLSAVDTNKYFVDHAGTSFDIVGGINNTTGSKAFYIAPASDPDVTGNCTISNDIDFTREKYNVIAINENVLIGIHTQDVFLTKALYYVLVYILQVRRDTLIRRWMELTSFTAADISREMPMLPSNVVSRFITLNGISRFYYTPDPDPDEVVLDTADYAVRVPKDEFLLDNEDDMIVRNTQ